MRSWIWRGFSTVVSLHLFSSPEARISCYTIGHVDRVLWMAIIWLIKVVCVLDPVHTENATFLSSTHTRWKRWLKTQLFENALHSGYFLKRYRSVFMWMLENGIFRWRWVTFGFSLSFVVVLSCFWHFKRTKFVIWNCKQKTTLLLSFKWWHVFRGLTMRMRCTYTIKLLSVFKTKQSIRVDG